MNKNRGRAWPWIFLYLSIFLWMALLYPVASQIRNRGPESIPGIVLFALGPAIIGGYLIVTGIKLFKARWLGLLIGLLIWIFTGYLVGIILQNIRFCDLHGSENGLFEKDFEKMGIPCLRLEREYGPLTETGRMKMRIEAFFERIS